MPRWDLVDWKNGIFSYLSSYKELEPYKLIRITIFCEGFFNIFGRAWWSPNWNDGLKSFPQIFNFSLHYLLRWISWRKSVDIHTNNIVNKNDEFLDISQGLSLFFFFQFKDWIFLIQYTERINTINPWNLFCLYIVMTVNNDVIHYTQNKPVTI